MTRSAGPEVPTPDKDRSIRESMELERRDARPLLTVSAVAVGCAIVWNLMFQMSPKYDDIMTRPQRWALIAFLIVLGAALVVVRMTFRARTRDQRPPIVSLSLLVLACLMASAYSADSAWRPCRGSTPELAGIALALTVAAFIVSFIEHSRSLRITSGLLCLFFLLANPVYAYAYSCSVNSSAHSSLRNGLAAARVFYTDDDTLVGFTPEVGESIEPALDWIPWTGDRIGSVVQVKVIDSDTILLLTFTDYGDPFCIVDSPEGTTYGESATANPADCADPSW